MVRVVTFTIALMARGFCRILFAWYRRGEEGKEEEEEEGRRKREVLGPGDVTEELTSPQGSGMSVHRQTIINTNKLQTEYIT